MSDSDASYKAHFSRFMAADPERLHMAAHSHHPWPDVAIDAHARCAEDATRLADRKWSYILEELFPAARRGIARVLSLPDQSSLAFGPNTHGFVLRLLSCLPTGAAPRILTTDGEFHSFTRQARRLEEEGLVAVTRVASAPFADFPARFAAAARSGPFDLAFFSYVFFESGYAVPDLAGLVEALAPHARLIAIDGYHGFMAVPSDLGGLAERAFYVAGGYKYAMAGEGAAFLHVPPGQAMRPRDTGWFAAFESLHGAPEGAVSYATDGSRFMGATFDPAGVYRMRAVLDWLEELGVTVADIHARAHALQARFVEGLARLDLAALAPAHLVVPVSAPNRGNFLAFRTARAAHIARALAARNVYTDVRRDHLRFGFGLYHDEDDVERLCAILGEVLD